jgi:phenylpyruvate tautomerase PptA (4-oxalocrotonate tautomerase family)
MKDVDPANAQRVRAAYVQPMPLLHVHSTAGAFNEESRQRCVALITDAALRAELVPDTPLHRLRCILFWDEAPIGRVYAGAAPADELVRGVIAEFYVSDGVIDPVRRQRFAADFHDAVAASWPGDERTVVTSIVFHQIPEGHWGRNGRIVRLPEMAADAGFEHLQEIASFPVLDNVG